MTLEGRRLYVDIGGRGPAGCTPLAKPFQPPPFENAQSCKLN